MRPWRVMTLLWLALAAWPSWAQDLAATCRASSSYDLTVRPGSLLFDRPAPAPSRVEIRDGALWTDGRAVRLGPEEQDRLSLFERELRQLVPQAKAVAARGVDMAARAVHDEAAGMGLSEETRAELDRRLAAHGAELKQRIAASSSTHDWQGPMIQQYANEVGTDIVPVVAGDLGQQALSAAMSGDLQAAASLRDRAGNLAVDLQPRLLQRMQALRPQIQALCPSIRRLAELQDGVRDADGRPLTLLQVGQ